jgi:hypothetical protein
MRRTYISPDFLSTPVFGTYNMLEESNFFGGKMLEIEDKIAINTQNIIYYQKGTGEQLDLATETTIRPVIWSSSNDKKTNHTLILDDSQPKYQLDKDTRWILTIDLKTILSNYIFSSMKRYRTFSGITSNMTYSENVNIALMEYISLNVLSRYKLSSTDLFVSYKDLRKQSILRYKNSWNEKIAIEGNKFNKFQSETSFDGTSVKLTFNQEKDSSNYSFEYFFNLNFDKI